MHGIHRSRSVSIGLLVLFVALRAAVAENAPPGGADTAPVLKIERLSCRAGGILSSHETPPASASEQTAVVGNTPSECGLGDRLAVTVDKESLTTWKAASKNDPKQLELILDGRVMKGVYGDPPGLADATFQFDLKRLSDKEENRTAWNTLLSHTKHRAKISVALAFKGDPVSDSDQRITLLVFPSYGWAVALFFVALLVAFLCLARLSDIIRDPGPEPEPGTRRYYSLGRSQMAWWFFVVLASFLYIWMITGDYDTITQGALILIGISAATGLGSAVVDSNKREEAIKKQADLRKERADLERQNATESVARLAQVRAELERLTPKSDCFVLDILRDDTGVSFHRFQIAGWTLVLSLVFIVGMLKDLAMPDFSATLLGLMGISSGTYIGFKLPDAAKTAAPSTGGGQNSP